MKTFKNIFIALTAMLAVGTFYSCDDDIEYIPAEQLNSAQVYFPSTNSLSFNLSGTESSFNVEIARVQTNDAVTVPLTLTGGEGFYTAPSSVAFAQGEDKKSIAISYDATKIGPDNYMDLTLSIGDESLTTPYGLANYTFNVGIPQTYTPRYVGDYTYNIYWGGVDPGLTLCQSDIYPDRWKIEHWGSDVDFFFTWNQETNEILVDDQFCANNSTYGPVNVCDIVTYAGSKDYGESFYDDANKVFNFAVIYYVSAGNFGNGFETFTITEAFKK